jgi:hypothetical protein
LFASLERPLQIIITVKTILNIMAPIIAMLEVMVTILDVALNK